MFGFFKKNKVPQWASFMDQGQYKTFMDALAGFLKSNGGPDHKIDDGLVLFYGENPFGCERVGLLNLAQSCAQGRPERYPGIVEAYFRSFKKTNEFFKNFDTEVQDFEKVKEYLAVRLQGEDYHSQVHDWAVFREVAEGLYAHLVFDLPDAVRTLNPDEAARWERTEDELFELARANVRRNYSSERQWQPVKSSGFWLFGADHYFAPNIIFDLERDEDLLGPGGAVIGVPHRQAALIHPIKSLAALEIIGRLVLVCHNLYTAGPGSVSPNLYWYREGRFVALPCVVKDKAIEIHSSDAFTALLNTLPPSEGEAEEPS